MDADTDKMGGRPAGLLPTFEALAPRSDQKRLFARR